jgi:hypothetical protein
MGLSCCYGVPRSGAEFYHITSKLKYGHQPHSTCIFKLFKFKPTINYLHPRHMVIHFVQTAKHFTVMCCYAVVINTWQPYDLCASVTSTCILVLIIVMYTDRDPKIKQQSSIGYVAALTLKCHYKVYE